MDDIVKQAMKKWPNVPAAYGWLGLDSRGHWFLRDAEAQALGNFTSGALGAKGHAVQMEKLNDFIGRNYAADAEGRWFFQNGPQRVYVELEHTPWVLRLQLLDGALRVNTHTGLPFAFTHSWLDEQGHIYLSGQLGLGLVHSLDTLVTADAMELDLLPEPEAVDSSALPTQFSYVISPADQNQLNNK